MSVVAEISNDGSTAFHFPFFFGLFSENSRSVSPKILDRTRNCE